jgi:poly(3-hydroxybutyrate) depolymerase
MKILAAPLLLICLVATAACDLVSGDKGSTEDIFVAVDDTLRDARLYIPDGLAEGDAVRLLIAFHGSGDSGRAFQAGAGLDERAPDDLIIAYPTAAKGNWAEGCNCNVADRLQINDLGFVEALIDSVSARYSVAPERTFALGYSQGGLFAYRLACTLGDKISKVAAVSAPMSVPLSRMCRAADPVSVMTLHGRRDGVLPWAGSDNGALSLLSATDTAVYWADKRACEPSVQTRYQSGDATLVASEWNACEAGTRVHLYQMTDGVHAWYTKSPDNRTFLFDFFGL